MFCFRRRSERSRTHAGVLDGAGDVEGLSGTGRTDANFAIGIDPHPQPLKKFKAGSRKLLLPPLNKFVARQRSGMVRAAGD